jgi:hypothetical protein
MNRYNVFGGVLTSSIPFPELEPAAPAAAPIAWEWSLLVRSNLAAAGGVLLGAEELAAGIHARLFRTAVGLRLEFDDTGTFEVADQGTAITWAPRDGHDPELARVDLAGRVLAAAVHERGSICLHGSAVSLGDTAVAFLAPKGAGKSTLAATFLTTGNAALLTDDTLPVDPSSGMARPGVQSVRLVADAAERVTVLGAARSGLSDKQMFEHLPSALIERRELPLGAIYEIVPQPNAPGDVHVHRTALAAPEATLTLMRHCKLGALLGGSEARHVFDRSATLAARVPVYRLHVVRDASALREVAQTIRSWHQ